MTWDVRIDCIVDWLDTQDDATVAAVEEAIGVLERVGPSLGRPLVDSVKGSSIKNLKELRPSSSGRSCVRILFVFDPERRAIMLVAGDKSLGKRGRLMWSGWYRRAIPRAERVYQQYLDERAERHGHS